MCWQPWQVRACNTGVGAGTRKPAVGDDVLTCAVCELLPGIVSALRSELARPEVPQETTKARRGLFVALSFYWVLEQLHYTALRERFGLCAPLLLQTLDGNADAAVRLVGLAALRMLLERAMAVEVQHFVPPLAHPRY